MSVAFAERLELEIDGAFMRLPRPDDVAELHAIAKNRPQLQEEMPWAQNLDALPDVVANGCAGIVAGNRLGYRIMRTIDGHDVIAGSIGLEKPEQEQEQKNAILYDQWTLGYWLSPDFRGQRLASSAARVLLAYARDILPVKCVALDIADDNIASQRVARAIKARPTNAVQWISFAPDGKLYPFRRWDLQL